MSKSVYVYFDQTSWRWWLHCSANDWRHIFSRVAGTEVATPCFTWFSYFEGGLAKWQSECWCCDGHCWESHPEIEIQSVAAEAPVFTTSVNTGGLFRCHKQSQAARPAISFKAAVQPKYTFSQTPEAAGDSFSKLNKREKSSTWSVSRIHIARVTVLKMKSWI